MTKIAIIGGGASGMMAALTAKNSNNHIDLYEKNQTLGKKITVSGNGRCNITNANITKYDYFGNDLDFLDTPLKEFGYEKFEKFCNDMGLYLSINSDGKVYPRSYEASSVLNLFQENLKLKKVGIKLAHEIESIKKSDGKFIIHVKDKKPQIYDRVLVSSGSKAAGKLGGTTFSQKIAKSFGHNVYENFPALVQLETKKIENSFLSGTKIEAKVSLLGKEFGNISVFGDVLFTKYGLSGFAILDISFYVSKMLIEKKEVELSMDMMPAFDKNELYSKLIHSCKKNPYYDFEMALHGLLPFKIAKVLAERLGYVHKKVNDLNTKDIKKAVHMIKDFRWSVLDTHGFDYAEVCGGGIDTLEIDPYTMESKLIKDLYFSGETLDIVGKRGGYNFAFAWMSGYLAGKSLGQIRRNSK